MDDMDLKILIADGSSVYKKMFTQAAKEVAPKADVTCVSQGDEVLDKIRKNDYDIIIADAEMPGADIYKILKQVMLEIPKSLVLVTARPATAGSSLFSEALAKGASDYMIKPIYNSYNENLEVIKNKLADIFKILYDENRKKNRKYGSSYVRNTNTDLANNNANISVNTDTGGQDNRQKKIVRKSRFNPGIVLIAASTGGPLALKTILSQLKENFPAPILIVQHMPSHFTETMTNHLNSGCKLKVKTAESRESVVPGIVYAAPGGIHMKLDAKHKIYFDSSPPIHGVRPSADALFESVADFYTGMGVLVVILTGMGSDGQQGLAKLKEKRDCFCLAQSEETCVVYGMPRSVVESGLADKIVGLDEMAKEIESFNFNFTPPDKQEKS